MGLLRAAFLTLLVAGIPSFASAQQTAIDLLRQCQGREPQQAPEIGLIACASYLSGILDAHAVLSGIKGGLPAPAFCLPAAGISNEQTMRVFIKWADNHPEWLHDSARISVFGALKEAFPCP